MSGLDGYSLCCLSNVLWFAKSGTERKGYTHMSNPYCLLSALKQPQIYSHKEMEVIIPGELL